ncbi:hypothetical protein FH972_023041 [Carpinus fangiana]|uniref:Cullin family profile domain-containing protein n=1 Tax=Carpinus fangiana TaxID=176857 RepID=A0A5N6KU14_9ROSI|nr:hypothetical protein FH972_023041 [Carpinus fangiana]
MISGRGKTKIRPPRKGLTSSSADVDFEETWANVASCLQQMHTKNASHLSFEVIYRWAYKIVLKKMGGTFYDRFQAFERKWLDETVRPNLETLLSPAFTSTTHSTEVPATVNERRIAGETFLRGLTDAFADHQQVMNMTTDVFMYLDRVFCSDEHRASIYTTAMLLFRDCILRTRTHGGGQTLSKVLTHVILDNIAMERDGDVVNKTLIKSAVFMLEGLFESAQEQEDERLYLTAFEQDFLDSSRAFYQAEASRLLREADCATYCQQVRDRLHEEHNRCRSTLSETTQPRITAIVEEELIRSKIHDIILMESGVKHMVDNGKFSDLRLLYELNARIDPKKMELTEAIQRRVQELGAQINQQATEAAQERPAPSAKPQADGKTKSAPDRTINQQTVAAIQWVEGVLGLKDTYDTLWRDSFHSDPIIQPALTRSFSDFINMFPRSSEHISLFIDENMKKGLKDKTEQEADAVLEKAIVLLRYIQDKDMFERYYKKHLCKRLLMHKSVSPDVERQMIQRMKIELGNSFTSKLEQMFKDMDLSTGLTEGYRGRTKNAGDKRAELGISVLTSMVWPLETMQSGQDETEAKINCIYPPSIERIKKGFESFYAEKHSGRKLTWLPNMGTADLRVVFPKVPGKEGTALGKERRHEVNAPTYAMIVLLLFNDVPHGEYLTFNQIQSRTNIPSEALKRNLLSIAVAQKTRILLKEPMSREVNPTDTFTFNTSFQSPFLRIKVGLIASGNKVEGEKERRETERKNNDSRGFVIEAAIVRIMKQRKELSHQQLVTETLTQLSSQFRPDVTMIKKRIESLIERELRYYCTAIVVCRPLSQPLGHLVPDMASSMPPIAPRLLTVTSAAWLFPAKVAIMRIVHGKGAFVNAAFLVLGEGAAITALLFEAFLVDDTQAKIFDALLVCEGHEELVSTLRSIHSEETDPVDRLGKTHKSAPYAPFSLRQIIEFILFLPLNFIPWIGVPLFLWLTGYRAGPLQHHRYFKMRDFNRQERNAFVKTKRLGYTSFGCVALVLQLIPVLSMLFLMTTAAGSALWVSQIEDIRKADSASETDEPPPYEFTDNPV